MSQFTEEQKTEMMEMFQSSLTTALKALNDADPQSDDDDDESAFFEDLVNSLKNGKKSRRNNPVTKALRKSIQALQVRSLHECAEDMADARRRGEIFSARMDAMNKMNGLEEMVAMTRAIRIDE